MRGDFGSTVAPSTTGRLILEACFAEDGGALDVDGAPASDLDANLERGALLRVPFVVREPRDRCT